MNRLYRSILRSVFGLSWLEEVSIRRPEYSPSDSFELTLADALHSVSLTLKVDEFDGLSSDATDGRVNEFVWEAVRRLRGPSGLPVMQLKA